MPQDRDHSLTLVLGHAASGKSAFAEAEVLRAGQRATYVATAQIWDEEMRAKVRAHAARRGPAWSLVETPGDLAAACAACAGPVLVDCATLWLTGLTMAERDWRDPAEAWIAAMRGNASARFWVVSNDVGGGVTPEGALARRFQRDQGALNQMLAAAADRVVLVTAGIGQVLK